MTADFYWGVLTGAGAVVGLCFIAIIIGMVWIERDNAKRCEPIGPVGKDAPRRLP